MGLYRTSAYSFLLLSTAGLLQVAEAGFEGEYTFGGYDLSFRHDASFGYGITKEVSAGFHSITVTSNSYSGIFNEQNIFRTVQDYLTTDSGQQDSRNLYDGGLQGGTGTGTGTVYSADNGILMIADEENAFPLYFDRGTNLAVTVSPRDYDGDLYGYVEIGLLVRKGSHMDESSLNGKYVRYSFGNRVSGNATNGWGNTDSLSLDHVVMTFDGLGGYSETGTTWVANRTIEEVLITNGLDIAYGSYGLLDSTNQSHSEIGSYTVSSNGSMMINNLIPCQLSPDSQVAVSSFGMEEPDDHASLYFTVVVKQATHFNTTPIDAVFFLAEISEEFQQDSETAGVNNNYSGSGRSYVFLKSDGTFTQRLDGWGLENTFFNYPHIENNTNIYFTNGFLTQSNEKVVEFSSGTYSFTTNGQVNLSFMGGDFGVAQLSENGEFLVFGFSEGQETEAYSTMGIGIRRTPPEAAEEPVTFTGTTMSSTGLVITATCPANIPFESLYSENLKEGEWSSGGLFTSQTGEIEFTDPGVTNSSSGFYNATFAPW